MRARTRLAARTHLAARSLVGRLCAAPTAAEIARAGLANMRRLSLLLAVSLVWSFALAPVALAATLQAQMPKTTLVRPLTGEQIRQTLDQIEKRRQRQEAVTRGMQQALARSTAALASAAARSRPHIPSVTLLTQNGRLARRLDFAQVSLWKRELKTTHPAARRAATLHVWLGEWELAANEQPALARWHFAQAEHLTPRTDARHGLAAYDAAVSFYVGGAYADAVAAFHALLLPRTALPGYSRQLCALWWRHAAACDGYHQDHAWLGIPEPPQLDPLCGAAALAASLRALKMPSDRKTVLRSCRVTGEGSSLADLVAAGPGLGVHVRSLTATDQGLMALPKPLVAFVERDHFISVIRADRRGVAYLCSDCGPWPGGEVDLTWAQWHALSPGVYAAVTAPGSRWDLALASLAGVQLAFLPVPADAPGRPRHIASLLPALPAMRGVSLRQIPDNYYTCGGRYVTLQCLWYANSPVLSGGPQGKAPTGSGIDQPIAAFGPSAGDPVNLSTGEEEYEPDADLTVYNPHGPSVDWARNYTSLDSSTSVNGYGALIQRDFGLGWSQSYNVSLRTDYQSSSGQVQLANGATISFTVPTTSPSAGHPVLCPVATGTPIFVQHIYGSANNNYSITFPDRTTWVMSYVNADDLGRYYQLSQIIDRNGNAIDFNYLPNGYSILSSITGTDQNGNVYPLLTLTRDPSTRQVTAVSDCYGRSVYYQKASYNNYPSSEPGYELAGVSQVVPTGTTNAVANYGRYVYGYQEIGNPEGYYDAFLNAITTPSPTGSGTSTATITYDSSDQLVSSLADGNGNGAAIHYLSGTSTQVTLTGNTSYTYTVSYDNQMSQTSRTDGAGVAISTVNSFDPNDPYEPASETDGNGNTTQYTWDAFGNMLTETPPASGQRTPAATTNTYSYANFPLGELTQTQTGTKTPTSYTYYEPSGLVHTTAGPRPGTVGAAAILLASYAYDGLGNVTGMTKPGPNSTGGNASTYVTTAMNYTGDGGYSQADAVGQPLAVTDPLGHVTHLRYDARGNTAAVTDALGNETDFTYNIDDRPLSTTYPATGQSGGGRGSTLNTYLYSGPGAGDGYGPLASVQTFDEGNTSGAFRTVSYSYGPEGELRGVSGSTEPVTYAYDALYRLISLTDGGGHATSYFYNQQGYLYQVAYPGAGSPSAPLPAGTADTVTYGTDPAAGPGAAGSGYDGNGDVVRRTDGNGTVTAYTYADPQSKLTDVHYAPGSGVSALADTTYQYDQYGRRQAMADATGAHAYAYFDDDRPQAVTTTYAGLPAEAISYAYHPDGSRAGMSTPGGSFTYGYDAAGRLTSLGDSYGETYSWAYYDNDWRQSQTLCDGTVTTYAYDARGQMTDLLNQGVYIDDSEFRAPAQGGYDGAGDLTALVASGSGGLNSFPLGGTTAYAYDAKGELTGESSTRADGYAFTHAYDGAQNPTTFRSQAVGAATADNQLPGVPYDGDGAPTGPVALAGSGGGNNVALAAGYDPEGRLTALARYSAAYPNWTASYDGDGLRAHRADDSGDGAAYYLYDGERPVCELDGGGNVLAVNIFGANGLLARHTPSRGSYATDAYVFDMQGNVAGGFGDAPNVYDGFGQLQTEDSGEDACWAWGGQWGAYTDAGYLVLCTHRYYDPATGRFLTRDPIGYNGGVNLYGYTQNDPVNRSDPSGLFYVGLYRLTGGRVIYKTICGLRVIVGCYYPTEKLIRCLTGAGKCDPDYAPSPGAGSSGATAPVKPYTGQLCPPTVTEVLVG